MEDLSFYEQWSDDEAKIKAEQIVQGLVDKGFNFVYINSKTGKYGGRKSLTEFPPGLRQECYCLDGSDTMLRNRDYLINNIIDCLYNRVELEEVEG